MNVSSSLFGDASAQPPSSLIIASRESRLAMWQAENVQATLRALYPQCDVRILGMTTRGDQILDRTLSKVGGKGLFVKELEAALAEGRADLAVHCVKDVPMQLPDGFLMTVVMEREDPRDALVARQGTTLTALDDLPPGAVVGTSSLRRESMIRARYPHLQVASLRGNLDTRLGKLDRGDYAAIILAAAGLKRLGLAHRISALLDTDACLPAVGQGALCIEIAADRPDLARWLSPLHHAATASAVQAERVVSRMLGGSCEVPIAAFASWSDATDEASGTGGGRGELRLRARVAMPDGSHALQAHGEGAATTPDAAESIGRRVAESLIQQGALEIVNALVSHGGDRNPSAPPVSSAASASSIAAGDTGNGAGGGAPRADDAETGRPV
ncbi:hydroxymethylbilane synthase [Robbsia sp. KACC 23696]|uniref:hydroxymethylbilane synthase n=1 Tax=Robbsia sp. KACC 23696 TaxID=3149231 RepID=UPI00325B3493